MDRFERCIDSEVDVLQSHTADLNGVLAANPSLLGQNLVQYHFASQTTVDGIVNTPAVPPYQTTAKLLSLVDSKIRTAGSKERTRKYFNDFLTIVAGPMGCRDIAQRLDNAMSKDPTYERFNQPTSTNSLPGEGDRFRDRDFNDIYFKLSTRAHKWREIGSALNFSKDEIKNIESAVMLSAQGSKGYLRELLSQWLEWAPGDARGSTGYATRESLVAALRKANLGVLVEKFENTNAAMPRANDVLEIPPTTATNKPIQQQGKHSTHVVTNKNTEAMSEANESDAVEMPPTTATNKPIQQQGKRGTHVDSEIPIFAKKDMETVYDEKQPQQCPDDLEEAAKKFSKEAVILLVTVNLEELVAVYKLLKPPDMGSDLPKAITYRPNESIKFILGKFGNHDVVVIQASPGADCRHDVQAAVESLPSVQLIIAVGCAYGRRDKCALGDVLVSTSILAVSNSRAEGGKFIDDEKSGRRVTLLARERNTFAKQYNMMKFNCIKSEKKERNSEVHLGLIISGATLWNDKNLLQNVIDKHGRFIGGEMEGQELSQLAVYFEDRGRKVEIIIIKGVSDFGDGSKTQEWQYTASLAAATYAESKLQATPKMVYKLPGGLNTVTFDAPAGQVAQKPPNPFTVGLGQQQQMGEALFGQPGTVLGIPPQQQFRGFGSQQTQQQEGFVSGQQVAPNQQMQWRAQQQQPGMMGGVQQMPTHQVWGGQSQAGSQWGAGGQFGGAQHAQQFGGFPGAQQPQQQLSRFASGSQQQPQQLGGLGSGGGGWDPANEGGGLQQHPAQQGFMGGPPQQPPSPAGGAPNPFAPGSTKTTNPFL